MLVTNPQVLLASARKLARDAYPYFTVGLLRSRYVAAPGLGTLGVTPNFTIYFDPEFVVNLCNASGYSNTAPLAFILVHEMMHPLRKHSTRTNAMLKTLHLEGCTLTEQQVREMMNIAGDMEINDDIVKGPLQWPTDGVLPSSKGFADGKTMEEYMRLLMQQPPSSKSNQGASNKPGSGAPCGSGAGNPAPGEPEEKQAQGGDGAKQGSAYDAVANTDSEANMIRKLTAEAVRDAANKNPGSVPGEWAMWADSELSPPKVCWQDQLAHVLRGCVAYRAGMIERTYSRFNRKQGGLGFGSQAPRLCSWRAPVPRVGIAIDTSGSMSGTPIEQGIAEAVGILAACEAEVTLLVGDATLGSIRTVRSVKDMTDALVGGGGTDFRPVVRAAEKVQPALDVLVYVTDGCGPAPTDAPDGFDFIWLLVGAHAQTPATWGTVIKVADKANG